MPQTQGLRGERRISGEKLRGEMSVSGMGHCVWVGLRVLPLLVDAVDVGLDFGNASLDSGAERLVIVVLGGVSIGVTAVGKDSQLVIVGVAAANALRDESRALDREVGRKGDATDDDLDKARVKDRDFVHNVRVFIRRTGVGKCGTRGGRA